MVVNKAVKSDGSILQVGDEVEAWAKAIDGRQMWFHKSCEGVIFVVEKITVHPYCSCGYMVLVHAKGQPDRKLLGVKKEGIDFVDGISADWFQKIK